MIKILLLAIIVWLLYRILRRYTAGLQAAGREQRPATATMVQCAYCGLHLPEEESFSASGRHYCSKAHSQQAEA